MYVDYVLKLDLPYRAKINTWFGRRRALPTNIDAGINCDPDLARRAY